MSKVQAKDNHGELYNYSTMRGCIRSEIINKLNRISFSATTGERIILVRVAGEWVLETSNYKD